MQCVEEHLSSERQVQGSASLFPVSPQGVRPGDTSQSPSGQVGKRTARNFQCVGPHATQTCSSFCKETEHRGQRLRAGRVVIHRLDPRSPNSPAAPAQCSTSSLPRSRRLDLHPRSDCKTILHRGSFLRNFSKRPSARSPLARPLEARKPCAGLSRRSAVTRWYVWSKDDWFRIDVPAPGTRFRTLQSHSFHSACRAPSFVNTRIIARDLCFGFF